MHNTWQILILKFLSSCENPDDAYITTFHPVEMDARVSVPTHFKRFSMKMFTFLEDQKVLKHEVKGCLISTTKGCMPVTLF